MDSSKAILNIVARRKAQLVDYNYKLTSVIENNSELFNLESKIKDLVLMQAQDNVKNNKELNELIKAKTDILKKLGLEAPPPPACKKCGDSGLFMGKPCECAIRLTISKTSELGIMLHDFNSVKLDVFNEPDLVRIKKAYNDIYTLSKSYPNVKKTIAVIMGSTGTGKTYLAGCAANELIKNSQSVIALTAFNLNNRFLKFHTTFDNSKSDYLEPLIETSALIIDDLGTESILKNVTLEYLYQIINERTLTRKFTLITSNLSPDALLNRYGARIYSRIFDKALCYPTILTGKDLRSLT